ncbi:hypothetical protein VPH35_119206 [Triticum aestivum]
MPLVAAPPCLVHCPRRFASAHLQTPVHNPTPLIRRAIQHTCSNPAFILGGSWRGVACIAFHTPAARNDVIRHSPIEFEGNTVTIEPVEHADRSIAIFTDLAEIEVSEFPHELWHNDGIRLALAFLCDVCAVDDFCLHDIDYTSVRALVLLQSGKPAPPGLVIQLPPINEIKIAKVVEVSRWHHGDGANPFGVNSSDGRAGERTPPTAGPGRLPAASLLTHVPSLLLLAAPAATPPCRLSFPLPGLHVTRLPSLTMTRSARKACTSLDAVHAPVVAALAPPVIRPLPRVAAVDPPTPPVDVGAGVVAGHVLPSDTSGFALVAPAAPAFPAPSTFTFSDGESSRANALTLHDLDTHECTARKERRRSARDRSVSKDKLRRSVRLAAKETKYSAMLARAVKAKAARLSASDVDTAIGRAIQDARLDAPDVPPALSEDLATIALLCGADDGHRDAILSSEEAASGDDTEP